MKTIILHSQDPHLATQVATQMNCMVEDRGTHFRFHTNSNVTLNDLRQTHMQDFNYLPKVDLSQIKLFVSDMDSTLINIECIDEIADFANLKPQVAHITEQAMQGEIDFDSALIQRVALLKGLDVAVLDEVYNQRLQPNPGVTELLEFFKSKNIKSAVVSGGFTYFTHRLTQDLGLDDALANTLEITNNKLTGTIKGAIINANAKAQFVKNLCNRQNLFYDQVIVAGDGANDLMMMKIAGVSVAYHAKPVVAEKADIVIRFGGLGKIKDFFDE